MAIMCWSKNTKSARDGEIVVALIDCSEATLKRLFREGDRIRLSPRTPRCNRLLFRRRRYEVQGRVIGVLRKY